MSKLDQSKPFSQIYGDDEGRAFMQNGVYFKADGSPFEQAKPKAAAPRAAVKAVKAVTASAEADQVASQLTQE